MSSYFHIVNNVVVNAIECEEAQIDSLGFEGLFLLCVDHPHAWVGSTLEDGVLSERPEVDPPIEG
jgi:hypothetical protein